LLIVLPSIVLVGYYLAVLLFDIASSYAIIRTPYCLAYLIVLLASLSHSIPFLLTYAYY
jgi:hypothetical protein